MLRRMRILFFVLVVLGLTACGWGLKKNMPPEGVKDTLLRLSEKGHRQVLMVTNDDSKSTSALVYAFEEESPLKWKGAFSAIEASIGRTGFAPLGEKREGDGRSPSGVYSLRRAFGYGPEDVKIDYIQVTKEDIWVDDAGSPDYNRLVKKGDTTAVSFEEMRRDDDLYKYGIVVEYNTDPVIKGHGSAIFMHIWRGPERPTAGCVAMSEQNILKILNWLDPSKKPVVVMGTRKDVSGLLDNMAGEPLSVESVL